MALQLNLFTASSGELQSDGYAGIEQQVNNWLEFMEITRSQLIDVRMGLSFDDLVIAVIVDKEKSDDRIAVALEKLADNTSESPDLDRIATTLNTIQHHGLTVEPIGGSRP